MKETKYEFVMSHWLGDDKKADLYRDRKNRDVWYIFENLELKRTFKKQLYISAKDTFINIVSSPDYKMKIDEVG